MLDIGEKCAKSASATTIDEAVEAAKEVGYPLIVRAAYALGGLGSGFCSNETELVSLCKKCFSVSPQVLIEKSMKGWKEIEYEVVRDIHDNCITVCNMEVSSKSYSRNDCKFNQSNIGILKVKGHHTTILSFLLLLLLL